MGRLLRLGGISLIIGTLVLMVGGFASLQHAKTDKIIELVPGLIAAKTSEIWVSLVPRIGVVLVALGVISIIAALFFFIINRLLRKT